MKDYMQVYFFAITDLVCDTAILAPNPLGKG